MTKKIYVLPESSQIEHKESRSGLSKDFWESYSAFANTKGGHIYLGVREDKKESDIKKRFYVVGVEDEEKIIHDLTTSLNNPQKVSHNVVKENEDIEILTYDFGLKVIRVYVREIDELQKPVFIDNNITMTYIRKQTSDIKIKNDELKAIIRSSREILDTEILTHYGIKNLSSIAIQRYRSYLIGNKEDSYYGQMNTQELLEFLGVLKENRQGEMGVTVGGLLFFGKYQSILSEFPHFHLDYFVKSDFNRWQDRVSTGDPEYPDLNIFMYYDIVMNKLRGLTTNPFMLDANQQRIMIGSRKDEALREGLANMLTHADYSLPGGILLTVFSNYFEFKNSGNMRVSLEKFFTTNQTSVRNPIISVLFRTIRVGERAGSGGIELYQFAKEFALKVPEIESDATSTTLRIWMVDLIRANPDLSQKELGVLSFLTKSLIPATRSEIQDAIEEPNKNKMLETLTSLESKKLIIKFGKSRGTKYMVPFTDEQFIGHILHIIREMTKP